MNIRQMQKLSPDMHGILDYATGAALLAAPNLLGFARARGNAAKTARLFGGLILGQAMLTDYKYGLLKVLPFRMHLAMDWALGPFMALSPFLFGFRGGRKPASWLTHVIAGTWATVTTAMTRPSDAAEWEDEEMMEDDRELAYGRREEIEWEPAGRGRMPAGSG
jgi:hypothetical protein